jgi:hypothetical protein
MQLTVILAGLLSALPSTISARTSSTTHYDGPYMCGYVLTVRNSSAYAGISAYSSCTAIYYNQSIPGYQDAFAYSIFRGCRCTFHRYVPLCKEKIIRWKLLGVKTSAWVGTMRRYMKGLLGRSARSPISMSRSPSGTIVKPWPCRAIGVEQSR